MAEEHQVVRLFDRDGDGIYSDDREVFIADIPWEGGHDTRTIVFDEIEEKLYLSVGSPCDLCRQEPGAQLNYLSEPAVPYSPERGTILQFAADGSGRRVFATGVRNVIGLAMHPVTNQLWGNHNHYDLAGPHLPPEWIDVIRDNGFYGLPFAYGYQVYVDFSVPEYQPVLPLTRPDSVRVESMQRSVALVPAHLAPMAIHFYEGDLFPTLYRHAAFVALHGGLVEDNLAAVPGFKVIALFSEPDGSGARVADFLTGFAPSFRRDDLWGKPVGLATDSRGRLYLSSDYGDAVYRLDHSPLMGSWKHDLPIWLVEGGRLDIDLEVQLQRRALGGGPPVLRADLSELGGPTALPLESLDDSTYILRTTLDVDAPVGRRMVVVRIQQGPHQMELVQAIAVAPANDQRVFSGGGGHAWNLEPAGGIGLEVGAEPLNYEGRPVFPFIAGPETGVWSLVFRRGAAVDAAGYRALRLAFHPGDLEPDSAAFLAIQLQRGDTGLEEELEELRREEEDDRLEEERGLEGGEEEDEEEGEVPVEEVDEGETPGLVPEDEGEEKVASDEGRRVDLLAGGLDGPRVDLAERAWQVVEIPLDALGPVGSIESIRLSGDLPGPFYLGDLRLVTVASPATAVRETYRAATTDRLALGQNYPNPFNGATVIRFDLPQGGPVDLALYNLAGQKVATLVAGYRAAGSYSVHWEGLDAAGRPLASGLYLYRLRAGTQMERRKLSLLR